jgi:hypothetical protein
VFTSDSIYPFSLFKGSLSCKIATNILLFKIKPTLVIHHDLRVGRGFCWVSQSEINSLYEFKGGDDKVEKTSCVESKRIAKSDQQI